MKKWLKDNRGVLVFILCLGLFRTAIADWNPVPTGSMRPTILEGDVVLVNRLAYDLKVPFTDISLARLGDPQRGDIVTFSSPKDGTRLIKRLVALPGDIVELRDNRLFINGQPAEYSNVSTVREPVGVGRIVDATRATEAFDHSSRTVQFLPVSNARSDFGPIVVPAGAYFMMGDNRDDSEDSRYIGSVPRELLIGRAGRILVSADIKQDWRPRFERTVSPLR
ncbi:MAG: signal peptidase I [Xanthomonadales bacterium]|uniref:signal peptidase I n=1 Tax=Dokdonella sp. TaxID=2291710 RepID=UPI002D14737A|nr:signal peptidase I [Xanthomonadales bacterium]MBL0221394.1 signal peptidase I [Xanthomonadales bacterium]HQX64661.1 signal peptidase I [Dokdonella sp.]HQY54064.1 signal peptidase I [Dokdonella sp.]HQZ61472.1 signal peptidase I [Dokdonella sp.]